MVYLFAGIVVGVTLVGGYLLRALVARILRGQRTQPVCDALTGVLAKQYHLALRLVKDLRYRVRNGRHEGAAMRYVAVFDPAKLADGASWYDNYAAIVKDRSAVQFEARELTTNKFYVEDHRTGQLIFVDQAA